MQNRLLCLNRRMLLACVLRLVPRTEIMYLTGSVFGWAGQRHGRAPVLRNVIPLFVHNYMYITYTRLRPSELDLVNLTVLAYEVHKSCLAYACMYPRIYEPFYR